MLRSMTALAILCLTFQPAFAQYSPFIPADLERDLVNELSGDLAWDNLRWLAHYHRTGGSDDYHASAEFIETKAKEYGLENVAIVRQDANSYGWSASSGELWVISPEEIKIGSYAEIAVSLASNSRTTHATAALVDIGAGTNESDYAGKDVKGKIVLTSSSPGAVMQRAVWERGAIGVVSYQYQTFPRLSDMVERPDQVAYSGIPYESADGKPGTFGFMISPRKGKLLSDLLKQGPVEMKVDIEAAFARTKWQEYVEGWIRGTEPDAQHVVLTAHLQEEKPSYNDDGSGCVSILEIARTINRLIAEGRIERPKRSIRFWWTTEISSEYQFFQDNPGEAKRMLAALNQDMVAAKQSMGSRIQHATRTPHSIPSYVSDVFENIVRYVEIGNTQFLAAAQAGSKQPYSKPILSHLGTRERFGMMVIPFFNNTDHMVFNEGVIGVPAVTLTNMPDDFIHSTDDDFHTADQTQLKRNAFIVAATALYLATASQPEIPILASEVYYKALSRIADDARAARAHIDLSGNDEKAEAYRSARSTVHQAFRRERAALRSITAVSGDGSRNTAFITQFTRQLDEKEDDYLDRIDEYYAATTRSRGLPSTDLTNAERQMDRKVPKNNPNLREYFAKRQQVGYVAGLHDLMRFEAFSFVDGKRSFYDIFRAVEAEAISAGRFYYGMVTAKAIEELLDKAVQAGVLELE